MFSQKKSFFRRKMFYVIVAAILGFGYFINNVPADLPAGDDLSANISKPVNEPVGQQKDVNHKADIDAQNFPEDVQGQDSLPEEEGYYLVKEVDGIIKIFYYAPQGDERLIDETDIAFSLIGEEDQKLFSKGIILKSEEELQSLLQDFES